MVREVRGLVVIGCLEVDGDELVGDVTLLGDKGHADRATGLWGPVKSEYRCHNKLFGTVLVCRNR